MFSEFYTAELDPVTRTSWTAKSTANSPIKRLSGPNPHPIIGVGKEAASALPDGGESGYYIDPRGCSKQAV